VVVEKNAQKADRFFNNRFIIMQPTFYSKEEAIQYLTFSQTCYTIFLLQTYDFVSLGGFCRL